MSKRAVTYSTIGIVLLGLAACGGSKVKGGGARTASAASMSKSSQKTGSAAKGKQSAAMSSGSSRDGVTCDAALEGLGFCADASTIVFCAGGDWYALDCEELASGAFCGQDGSTIDCYVTE